MATKTQGTLDRRAVMSALLDARGDSLIVTGLGSSCYDAGTATTQTLFICGAAWGRRDDGTGTCARPAVAARVVVTGDGEMLMAMGLLPPSAPNRRRTSRSS